LSTVKTRQAGAAAPPSRTVVHGWRAAVTSMAIVAMVASCSSAHRAAHPGTTTPTTTGAAPTTVAASTSKGKSKLATGASRPAAAYACPCNGLVAGSDPSALPAPILVADHMNNRLLVIDPNGKIAWEFPGPGDLLPGQTLDSPDDAFYTPDGRQIVVTQEDDQMISLVDVASHRIVWTYGQPGQPGFGNDQLDHPDDAMMNPQGDIILADIKNCRVLVLRPPLTSPVHVYGQTTNDCWHDPPLRWGSPNGAFPMRNGDYVVTEINGDWADGLSLGGQVSFSIHPPGVAYPSDTNEVSPGVFLTVDYSTPGQIVEFDRSGRLIWRYDPGPPNALSRPSLALPRSNGDILGNDDYNDRVIVVDPGTGRIVWQYGHTGVPGTAPGYLDDPDGVDLAAPDSLTATHAATMGPYP
jgi:outer membrane protein assembly factor BamB